MAKVGSKVRCEKCRINHLLCFCELFPQLNFSTKVLVIMHRAERMLPSNTARLATNSLINSELRIRGLENAPLDLTDLNSENNEHLVLFPSDNSIMLTPKFISSIKKPITLIIPDGSWNQARNTMRREAALQKLAKVTLPKGELSQYRLRAEPTDESVSTFEAIERALSIIHGDPATLELKKIFTIMVERTLWAKSLLHENDCRFPIPEKALFNRYHPPQN